MKASVITLHTVNNYGSAMQTYATQKVLEKIGCEVEFVDYWRKSNTPEELAKRMLNSKTMQRLKPIWGMSKVTENLAIRLLKTLYTNKESPMRAFIRKNVTLSPKRYYSFEELKNAPPVADVYITGSDQVWNSIWNDGIDHAFFLDYAPADKPRIAFSASIGRTKLDESEIDETRELLLKYSAISVREQSAVDLLQELGIDAELILDPTLMLGKEEWTRIEDTSAVPNKKYLLLYQLHDNDQFDQYALKLAQMHNWEIIRIGFGRTDKERVGHSLFNLSVEQFLGLFSHATCVLTDSFHATAFSLNLGTDFISVLPGRFGTRIESITELTGTGNRVLRSMENYTITENEIDKRHVEQVLEDQRKQGCAFLRRVISL